MNRSEAARVAILRALTDEWTYGPDLARAARLRASRFYPAIYHLEEAGLVESRWAELEPGRWAGARRVYRAVQS